MTDLVSSAAGISPENPQILYELKSRRLKHTDEAEPTLIHFRILGTTSPIINIGTNMFYHIRTSLARSRALWYGIKNGQSHNVTQMKSVCDLAEIVVPENFQRIWLCPIPGQWRTPAMDFHAQKALSEILKESCAMRRMEGERQWGSEFYSKST